MRRQTAATRPPHLAGIMVQNGYTDLYREVAYKGGVAHPNFMRAMNNIYLPHGNRKDGKVLDFEKAYKQYPYDNDFWTEYTANIENIACPVYVIASLADNGIHTPGSIRGYLRVKSETKYIELHPY